MQYIAYVYIAVISMYNNCTLVVKLNSNVWSTLCHRKLIFCHIKKP